MLPKPLAVGILTLVTLVWSVDFGAQFVTDHQPSPMVQGTFLALVGGALIRAGWVARKQIDGEAGADDQPGVVPGVSQDPAPGGRLEIPPTIPPPPPAPSQRDWPPRSPYGDWNRDSGRHRPLLKLREAWAWA